MNIEDIKEYIYDTRLLKKEIDKFPHTYKTLLCEECKNDGTLNQILRRKLSILHKDGEICKSIIPGTRFGMVIFYAFDKKYNIAIEGDRIGIKIYCMFDYVKKGKFYIECSSYWVLKDYLWEKVDENRTFFMGNFLKWI